MFVIRERLYAHPVEYSTVHIVSLAVAHLHDLFPRPGFGADFGAVNKTWVNKVYTVLVLRYGSVREGNVFNLLAPE